MAKNFLETSAFIKRYKREKGTDFLNSLFQSEENQFYYLNLSIFEIRKIFYRLRYWPLNQDQQISDEQLRDLESRFAADLVKMQRVVFTEEMIDRSVEILKDNWIPNIFDAAQLTAYLITREVYPDLLFVCSDSRSKLVDVARNIVGVSEVIIPE